MRLSCNGCRVLRKGCTDACTIRPCLQWIKTPEAQANATVFLAKFYGRAGLLNLLASTPTADQRPAVFRSLLYEACGRVVNPVYGAVGLLWSGTWNLCQAAVEAVLKGDPIVVQLDQPQQPDDLSKTPHHLLQIPPPPPPPNYDIRHVVVKPPPPPAADDAQQPQQQPLHKVAKPSRTRFKRTSSSTTTKRSKTHTATELPPPPVIPSQSQCHSASSVDDDCSQQRQQASLEDTDAEAASHVTTLAADEEDDDDDHQEHQQLGLCLDLTLGFADDLLMRRPPTSRGLAAASVSASSSSTCYRRSIGETGMGCADLRSHDRIILRLVASLTE